DNKNIDKSAVPKIYNFFYQAIFLSSLLEQITAQGAQMAADFARVEVGKHAADYLRDLVTLPEWKAVRQRLEECGRYSNPKMRRLEEVMLEHFGLKSSGENAPRDVSPIAAAAATAVGAGAAGRDGDLAARGVAD
ncbi:hypothetical protein Agub_g1136, partial [Astrephomene gubernaculifera]